MRFTLVAALLLLVGLGLLASGVAVTSSLETSLMRRLDQQLVEAKGPDAVLVCMTSPSSVTLQVSVPAAYGFVKV